MPNNIEWQPGWTRELTEMSGGSLMGEGDFGSVVAVSRFGEMAIRIGDKGELQVTFPERGVMCAYTDEKKLAFVSIDVDVFFDNLTDAELDTSANGGTDICRLQNDLRDSGKTMLVTVFPLLGKAGVEIWEEQKKVDEISEDDIDWAAGHGGEICWGVSRVCYYAATRGDELVIAMGEANDEKRTMLPVSISHEVDYMQILESPEAKRFWELGDKIILNR